MFKGSAVTTAHVEQSVDLTFMKELQRGFEIPVMISTENREELGTGKF